MLVQHDFFTRDGFSTRFTHELKQKIHKDYHESPLVKNSSQWENTITENSESKTNIKKKKKVETKEVKEKEKKSIKVISLFTVI